MYQEIINYIEQEPGVIFPIVIFGSIAIGIAGILFNKIKNAIKNLFSI